MDIHDRLNSLCAKLSAWPQPAGKVRGLRAVQEAVAHSPDQDKTLATMERTMPRWLAHYAAKPSKYWRRLDYLMVDGDWQTDPAGNENPSQGAARATETKETRDQRRGWWKEYAKTRRDAEFFASHVDTDAQDKAWLLELAETLPGEHYRPVKAPQLAARRSSQRY